MVFENRFKKKNNRINELGETVQKTKSEWKNYESTRNNISIDNVNLFLLDAKTSLAKRKFSYLSKIYKTKNNKNTNKIQNGIIQGINSKSL